MPRRDEYTAVARTIAAYLAERQRRDGDFPGPSNYGVSFALWLWTDFGVEFVEQLDRAWHRMKTSPPDTHGEFNIYALLQSRERLGPGPVDGVIRRLRFGGRHSANWMLLRAVCRARQGPCFSPVRSTLDARAALVRYGRGGFIADRPGVRSSAYHAFCGALLADLWRQRGVRWAGRAAVRAASSMAGFILPNGDGLYVGRGQHQIFGYGALLYLLEAAVELTGEERFAELADRVFRRLVMFQRGDGSFPLVVREGEPAEPWAPDPSLPGWYSYNRYADYLPFLGCFLLKAAQLDVMRLGPSKLGVSEPWLRRWEKAAYTAVLAEPSGAATNDLAFPYVCFRGESLFPCYGLEGEQVAPESMPLPYGVLASGQSYGFRDRLRYRLTDAGLAGTSRLVSHVRSFEFRDKGFVCRDDIKFRRRCTFSSFVPANFLFRTLRYSSERGFETWHRGAGARLSLEPEGSIHANAGVSAAGPLVALRHVRGRLEARAGETIHTELGVHFV